MKSFPLGKQNKLCSAIAIDALFAANNDVQAAIAYPIRILWRVNHARKANINTPKFFISVPKRRLHNAVDRVKMRRRIREAYRLLRPQTLSEISCSIDIAIIYIGNSLTPYSSVSRSLEKLLSKISSECSRNYSAES